MIYSGAKMIEIPIDHVGRNYFPDVNDLYGRTIQSISLFPSVVPLSGKASVNEEDYYGMSLNLTSDGSTYEVLNSPAIQYSSYYTLGKNVEVNQQLSLEHCYFDVQYLTQAGVIVAVLYFEADKQYRADAKTDLDSTNSFDTPLLLGAGYRNYLPDNRDMVDKHFRGFLIDSTMQYSPNGQPVDQYDLRPCYITLCKGSYAVIDRLPLQVFQQLWNIEKMRFDNILFDFEQSFIEVATNNEINLIINIQCTYER